MILLDKTHICLPEGGPGEKVGAKRKIGWNNRSSRELLLVYHAEKLIHSAPPSQWEKKWNSKRHRIREVQWEKKQNKTINQARSRLDKGMWDR